MKTIDFMFIGCLFLTLIAIEGVYSVPLFPPPTVKIITGTRYLEPIIHTGSTGTPTTTRSIPTNCPNLYAYNSAFQKCYLVNSTSLSFGDGNNTCISSGGSLVMPRTNDELAFLATLIPLPDYNDAFMGVTYRTINNISGYYYSDGTPYTLCNRTLDTPYSNFPLFTIEKSDNCSSNRVDRYTSNIICEATPF